MDYYSRYLDRLAERIEPLTQVRRRKKWTKAQEDAFQDIKSVLATYPVVQIFDLKKTTTVTTDAIETAVSAIISQNNNPVLYLSRRLTLAEQRYSNIEREALAVVYTCRRARHLLLGKKFLLQRDHRPLEFIFHPSRDLAKVTSARILQWALQLSAFDYDIQYVKGRSIHHVDALSRLPMLKETETDDSDQTFIHWTETDVLTREEIQDTSATDPLTSSIMKRVFVNKWSDFSPAESTYKAVRDRLTVEDGILCNGDLVVPPPSMRLRVIRSAHDDIHSGSLSTRNRVKLEAWWPGYCDDIEQYVKKCHKCAKNRPVNNKSTHQWPRCETPWDRVHMDHAHVESIGTILILVDSATGWPEAIRVKDRSANTVQTVLRAIFARQGVPRTLVSDNAPEF